MHKIATRSATEAGFIYAFGLRLCSLLMGYGVTYLLIEGKQSTPITSGETYGFRSPAVLVDKPVHTYVSSNYPITPSARNFLKAHY
jgi:hypothetical protein